MSEGLGWSLRCAAVAADPCFGLRADGIRPCGCSSRQHAAAFQGAGAQCAPYARCILQNHPASERTAGPSLCLRPNGRPGSAAIASLPRWSVPLTGRQPELEYYQTPRSDARRTSCSRGIAALHLQACPKIPRRGHAGGITEKGVQNRRFWGTFAYFSYKGKVGRRPGAGARGIK